MKIRDYLGAGVGLVIAVLIGEWARAGHSDTILAGLALAYAGAGAVAGYATVHAGTRKKQLLCVGVGLAMCLLVAAVMVLYRWLLCC